MCRAKSKVRAFYAQKAQEQGLYYVEKAMLVEFRFKNFRSFRDEQLLSLVAGRDKVLGHNLVSAGKLRLLKMAAVYGANASGKSNLIKAMDTMRNLVVGSADFKPGARLNVKPFLLDDKTQGAPTLFEVTFFHNGIRYQYGFTATTERFHQEWLIAYPKGAGQTWYKRTFDKKRMDYDWKYSTFLKGDKAKLAEKTRGNALFLSVASQWNNEQLMTVYEWFEDKLRVAPPKEKFRPVTAELLLDVEGKRKARDDLYEFVTESLQKADLGIRGVNVKKLKLDRDKTKLPIDMPEEIREKVFERLELEPLLKVEMLHSHPTTRREHAFPLQEESDGTQRFFQLLGPWLQTVVLGFTVFIDELEVSLHPLLTRQLIEFIQHRDKRKAKAQVIFATHDTTLLDPELFRRDQIWFTEKDEVGASSLYSMADYKEHRPRKGEAMQKRYLSGRYGAIPILEDFGL
jgi:AAA15 family ATPase/GTPase